MPFLSDVGQRALRQRVTPVELYEESEFFETLGAAFDLTIDEELSISALRNRQMFDERKENVRSLLNDGIIDADQYTSPRGRFNYDQLSKDLENTEYEGLIKNNESLRKERNEMLRIRRERNKKVIERGSGFAQFLGMGGGLLLDPVNIASIGGGLFLTAARSGTVLGRALYGLRTEAGLAAASESAIQPLVFYHKNNIDSPFSVNDALTNIAVASAFGGALGFGFGGIAGYFGRAAEKSREAFVNALPDKPIKIETSNIAFIDAAFPSFVPSGQGRTSVKTTFNKNQIDKIVKRSKENRERLTEAKLVARQEREAIQDQYDFGLINSSERTQRINNVNDSFRGIQEQIDKDDLILDAILNATGSTKFRIGIEKMRSLSKLVEDFAFERPDTANNILAKELDKYLEQDIEQQITNIPRLVSDLQKDLEKLQKRDKTMQSWIVSRGGLNRKDFESSGNFDRNDFNPKKSKLSGQFWRSGNQGLTVDGLIEELNQDGTLAYNFRFEEGVQPLMTNEAIEFVENIVANPRLLRSAEARAQAEDFERQIFELENLTEGQLREGQLQQRFQSAQEGIVTEHQEALIRYSQVAQAFEEDLLEPQDFIPDKDFANLTETDIQIKDIERKVLESQGLSEEHDKIMSEYARLADQDQDITLELEDIGEVNIKQFVEKQENDLSALNELKRCVRGV
tara:strand:- start:4360 stop:6417 length:2058 start_codon:yes stop_codon:yes gene_type:complete